MDAERRCPSCGKPLPPNAPQGLCPTCLLEAGLATRTPAAAPPAGSSGPRRFVAPAIEALVPLFPQLEILSLVGQGGMGAVYRARQPSLDRIVALKILPSQTGHGAGFEERFTREARALARLQHPNIVAVHDFGTAGGFHYFIMEFVDGVTLRRVFTSSRTTPREALAIVPQICDALQYAHDKGIVHRDIKPENILIDKAGSVKIADFGLAKLIGGEPGDLAITGERDVMGTPHYMAPEQIEHPLEVDHRADIYSLGVVFYQMLTGELPLGRFAPPSRKVQIDVRLDEVVLRTLDKEPEQRYQQARGLKTAVETIATTRAPGGEGVSDAATRRRQPVIFIAAAALVVLLVVGASFASWFSRSAAGSQVVVETSEPSRVFPGGTSSSHPAASPASTTATNSGAPHNREKETEARARTRTSDATQGAARARETQVTVLEPEPSRKEFEAAPGAETIPSRPAAGLQRGYQASIPVPADFDTMEQNPTILRIQLRQAEAEKADMENRVSLGVVSRSELQRVLEKIELYRARLEGDRVRFARVKLAAAQRQLEAATARFNSGNAPGVEVQLATDDVHIARARLQEAEARAQESPRN